MRHADHFATYDQRETARQWFSEASRHKVQA